MTNKIQGGEKASRKCPSCHSKNVWKDGTRKTKNGSIQRYVCRDCWRRFSGSSILSVGANNSGKRQVCATRMEAKNLAEKEPLESGLAGATNVEVDIKGKIVEFLWHLKKEGYSQKTIEVYNKRLIQLAKKCDILNPERVKEVVASKDTWNNSTKTLTVAAYKAFTVFAGIPFKPPKYRQQQKIPFIPLEKEIDALIAGCSRRIAPLIQLLKETGMRIGEARSLRWTNIDLESRVITLNHPEKNSNPRMFKISPKLIAMINTLPKRKGGPFRVNMANLYRDFESQRKRIAAKLQNPRLQRVTFRTFRHWKATMEYHKTKDILHVMRLLGHKNIKNTLIYTQLVNFENDDYHFAIAKDVDEAGKLIQAGFDYICHHNEAMLFRKRK